jgi:SAM-dependent methyltransferase
MKNILSSTLADTYNNKTQKKNLKNLKFLKQYIHPMSKIYLDLLTGVVRTELKYSENQILDYWSNKIFPSKNLDDYNSNLPFAVARLTYVAENIKNFIQKKNIKNVDLCDFACGEGTLLRILKKDIFNNICGVEGSLKLSDHIKKKYNVQCYNAGLGFGDIKKINFKKKINFGILSWVLCNCINPLKVLQEIRDVLDDNAYLCICESSRILVPFKKNLKDYFAKRHPEDIHPWHFSATSLESLLNLAGFEVHFKNRYKDSNELLLISKKTKKKFEILKRDDPKKVLRFFKKWHEISSNSKTLFD